MNEQEQFQTNLLRVLVAELHFSNLLQFAFQKHGKAFLDLTEEERVATIVQVQDHIQALFQRVTPEALANPGNMADLLSRIPISGKPQ